MHCMAGKCIVVCTFDITNDSTVIMCMYLCLSDSEIGNGLCLCSMYLHLILCIRNV